MPGGRTPSDTDLFDRTMRDIEQRAAALQQSIAHLAATMKGQPLPDCLDPRWPICATPKRSLARSAPAPRPPGPKPTSCPQPSGSSAPPSGEMPSATDM